MIILPYFHKKGCWILNKSRLLSIQISRLRVLKSRNLIAQKMKRNMSSTQGVDYHREIVFGLKEEVTVLGK